MPIADVLRLLCAIGGGLLAPLCVYCGAVRMSLDQRVRFAALALIGVVVVGGQIDAWGKPGTWRLPVLAVGLGFALYGVIAFLRGHRHGHT